MKRMILVMTALMMFALGCSKEFFVDVSKEGAVIPNFKLEDLGGKKIDSDSILNNGKKTLLIIAAEWCPHCKEESPEIQRFYDEYKDKVNVLVIFTNSSSSLDKVKEYITKNGYSYPAYYDADGSIIRGFGVTGFPFNLKIDNGKVVKQLELPVNYEMMVKEMIE